MLGLPSDDAVVRLPLDEVAGLPLHPLVVHAVVVLVPLTALGLVVMASSGARSKRYSPAVIFVASVAALAAFLSKWSGEALRSDMEGLPASIHFQYGAALPWVALALWALVCVMALMDRQGGGSRNVVGTVFSLASMVLAFAAVVLTVLTGHAGAQLVWG